MKIGLRITLLMVVMNLISIGVIGSVISVQARNAAEDLAGQLTLVRARHLGEEFNNFLDSYWQMISATAAIMGQFESVPVEARRTFLNDAIRSIVTGGEFVANAWVIWDANALDGADVARIGAPGTDDHGRFVPGYVRTQTGTIEPHLRRDFDNDDFYLLPRTMGRQIITNPYFRTLAGESRNISTISAPVRNRTGEIVGIVGLDLGLVRLNILGQEFTRVFEGTLTAAFSNDGTIVSHFDSQRIGRNMRETEREILGDKLVPFANAVQSGEEMDSNIHIGGDLFRFFMVPIPVADFPDKWAFVIAMPMDEVLADTNTMIVIAIIICIAMLVVVIVIALIVSKGVARPIVNMAGVLKDIASGEGDLTVSLPHSGKDETAEASHYFNQTIGKIRDLIIAIKNQAAILSDIGNDLASNMTQTASAMNEIAANIQSIKGRVMSQSASVTETNATMEQVTVNIDRLNGQVERQSGAVSQASSAIEQMMANIQSVTATLIKNAENVRILQESSETGKSSLQEVASDIQEIARESEGLLEINAVMENIASQTNLLSMNAAIEAAHAGEAGKGFAVVADEIRKLAESSGEQSKTIGDVLKRIKESVDKILRSTGKVMDQFETINSGIRVVADQEEVIRNAMDEQNQGSKQVLQAASLVNEITQQVKDDSAEMAEGTEGIMQETKNLERATREITSGINEMAASATEVNMAVNMVNDLSGRNRENISCLVKVVSQFKV